MPRINLLPWREELREQRRKEFLQYLALVLLATLAVIILAGTWLQGDVEDQQARNQFLRDKIATLDERLERIRELERQREELLERMQVIQDLQGNRPVSVRIFDQLVRTLPKGVFYTSVRMNGEQLDIGGIAESNNRVSQLMRNLDRSEWFTGPNLKGLKEAPDYGEQASSFQLTVTQTLPGRQDGGEDS